MAARRDPSRRDFLRSAALAGAGLTVGCAPSDSADVAASRVPPDMGPPDAGPPDTAPPPTPRELPRVPRRVLGASDLSVPILALGGGQTFDPRFDKILHRAFRAGVDFLDTALRYSDGMSHRTLAPFLSQVGRENVLVLSKGPLDERLSPGGLVRGLDICLDQLETDYLDLYFMHAVEHPRYLEPEYLRVGDRLRESGKTRLFGFSCCGERVVECMEKAARVGGIDAIMFRYSFARYGDLRLNRAMDACARAGIGLIAMKTQNAVPASDERVAGFRSRNLTLAQAKLRAVWADERIAAATSLMDNTRKLAENVVAAAAPAELTMGELGQLRGIATACAGLACQGCAQICESRIDGPVRVARPLRYLMYHDCYGERGRARELYGRLRPGERALDGVDFRRASAACPQGIDIEARLRVARATLAASA